MSGRAENERHAAPSEERPPQAEGEADPVGAEVSDREEAPEPPGAPGETDIAEAGAADDPREAIVGDGEAADPEQLAEALAEAVRQRDEYLDLLRRERAEFENFRKRANRERMEALDRGAEGVISDLLAVLDDFDRVLEAAERSEDTQLAKGVEMVHNGLRSALAEAGLEPVPGAGAPFDPNWHEAMMQVEADEEVEHPVVFEVLRAGYSFKGRVLRPASVSVAQ